MSQGASGNDGTPDRFNRNTNEVESPLFCSKCPSLEKEIKEFKIRENLKIKEQEKKINDLNKRIEQLEDGYNKSGISDQFDRNTKKVESPLYCSKCPSLEKEIEEFKMKANLKFKEQKGKINDQNKVIGQLKEKIEQLQFSNNKSGGTQISIWPFNQTSNQSPKPTGLRNEDVYCYMNAALQALSGSSKFVEEIKSLADENGELRKLNLFTNLLNSLNDTSQSSINAAYNDLFENWTKSGMQDAFEVMSFMLNEVIKEYKGKHKLIQTEWNKGNFPMVLKLTYKLECGRNHAIKTPIQTDLALHVPIPEKGGNITITDVLNEVVEGELISEYSCDTEGCRSKTGRKYIKLVEVPNILCIHIQRNKVSSGRMLKNNERIKLETDTLELSGNLFLNNNCKCTYQLCSVIDHSGSLTGGHYKCYKQFKNKWYCANDCSVREVQFTDFNDCGMYVLIYELVKKEEITSVAASVKQITFQEDCTLLLSMLHSSNVFMKKLEELRDFHLTLENIQKQVKFYDNGSTLDDLLFVILEPIKKEILESIKETEKPNASYIPMYLEWVESVQCSYEHQLSFQNITDFTFTVLVTDIKYRAISFSELMNELVKGIDIKGECKCSGCYSRSLKRFVKFENFPSILCIRIEREDHGNSSSGKYQKINIDKYLKLDKKFLMNGDEEGHYKLSSVVVHQNSKHNDSRYKCNKLQNNECYDDNDRIVEFNIISNSKIELLLFEKIDGNSKDVLSSNNDSKFEEISQVSNNAVLSMLLSSEILMKKLEYLQGFQLSKVNELVGALQDYRDKKKQTRYFDIKSTLNEVLHDILDPVKKEIEEASNCTSSSDIDIPLCLKLFIQTKCSRGHIKSKQELFEFTFTVTVKDNWGTKIALSKLMKDSVDGIDISSNKCLQSSCTSNTIKKIVKFVKLPNVLCIQIKRENSGRREFQKIYVDKTLKLDKKFFKDEDQEGVYKLRSVIVHSNSDSVQYKCYRYRNDDWTDNDERSFNFEDINDSKIELLLYEVETEKLEINSKNNIIIQNLYEGEPQDNSNAVLSMLLSSDILMKKLEDLKGFQLSKVNELVGALQDYRDNKKQTRYYDIKSTLNEMFTYILDPVKEEITTFSTKIKQVGRFPLIFDLSEITKCKSNKDHVQLCEFSTELMLPLKVFWSRNNRISDLINTKFAVNYLDNKCKKSGVWVKCNGQMVKYLKFVNLPSILCIRLERSDFTFNNSSNQLSIHIDQEIKINKIFVENENAGVYKLCSVIVHSDSDSGPYKCYRYRDGKWVDDDNNTNEKINSFNAEFLMYEYCDVKSLLEKSRELISQSSSKYEQASAKTESNSNSKCPQTNVNSILTLMSSSDVFMKSLNDFIGKKQGARVNEVEKLWSALESVRYNKIQDVYFDFRGNCLDLLIGILEDPMKKMNDAINKIADLKKFTNPSSFSFDQEFKCDYVKHCTKITCLSFYISMVVPENTRGSNGKINFNDFINECVGGIKSFFVHFSCPFVYYRCSSTSGYMTYKMKYVPKVFIINLERNSRSSMKLTIDKEISVKTVNGAVFKYRLCGFLYQDGYGDINVVKLQNNEWFRFKGTEFVKKYNDHELADIQPDLLIYEQI